jgi:fructose-bisphosphate aldolase class II
MVTGAVALAEFAHVVAARYPIHVALHTDHCPKDKLDTYMRPLVAISAERVARGQEPLFQSHMWDGSAVPLAENLQIAAELLAKCTAAKTIMEMEIGVVGGEEDGIVGEMNEKLYSTPEDALATAEALGLGERGRYILAATFGNVHGVYAPGHVQLRPTVLKEIQDTVGQKYGKDKPFDLVFHGGSGSALEEIREAISYGVVKMNIDTDTQYAFTRPVAGFMFTNYDGVLKVDGDVGSKKAYDPRSYGKAGEAGMAQRVTHACEDLLTAGHHLSLWTTRTCWPGRLPPTCRRTRRRRPRSGRVRRPRRWRGGFRPTRRRGRRWRSVPSPRVMPSRPTPTRGPGTTGGWTSCAGRAGTATGRSRGSTRRTRASCGRCSCWAGPPARSARRTRRSAASSSCATAALPPPPS